MLWILVIQQILFAIIFIHANGRRNKFWRQIEENEKRFKARIAEIRGISDRTRTD